MINDDHCPHLDRRSFGQLAILGAAAAALGAGTAAAASASAFEALRGRPVTIGVLIFPNMDQIDFTGPLDVFGRVPGAKIRAIGSQREPFRDFLGGITLTPDVAVEDAGEVDLLHVPGGPGQQAMMDHAPVLHFVSCHAAAGKPIFSVCTGALICGAAGVLKGRRATTHWASFDLLPWFGAIPVQQRVVRDGALVTAAGVTAGIDGALTVAALLRGEEVAQEIQLDTQYAPEPPFHAGDPSTAPASVLKACTTRYRPITEARAATARQVAARLGVATPG
jgi:cyclohexyl-isocyanide hydratase